MKPDYPEHPEDVICLIEVGAVYKHAGRIEPPKPTGLRKFFASKTAGDIETSGGKRWYKTVAPFDHADADAVAAQIDAMRRDAHTFLDGPAKASYFTEVLESRVEWGVWLGTRGNFEPRPSDPDQPWPRHDQMKPKFLSGDITAQALRDALSAFNPASARQKKAEDAERRFNEAVHHATVLQSDVPLAKPLKFKK